MIRSQIKDNKCETQINGTAEDIIIEFRQLLNAFAKNDKLKLACALAILEYLNEEQG